MAGSFGKLTLAAARWACLLGFLSGCAAHSGGFSGTETVPLPAEMRMVLSPGKGGGETIVFSPSGSSPPRKESGAAGSAGAVAGTNRNGLSIPFSQPGGTPQQGAEADGAAHGGVPAESAAP